MFASGAKVPQVWMPYTLDFNRPQLIQVRTIPRLGLLPVLIVEQEVLGLVVVQVMAELSGFWVSFQSQTKTSEKVYGIQSV